MYKRQGKRDVRAIVVGNQVVSAMERTGVKDFRANLSQGGSGRKIELTDIQKDLCVRASQALGLNFSGVDLMIDEQKKAYVIEINGNPGTGIIKVTGQNHFVDLIKLIEDKVGKESKGTAKFESPEKAELQKAYLELDRLKMELVEEKDKCERFKYAYEIVTKGF